MTQSILSARERRSQTKMIMKLFELWKLTDEQQLCLLGLPLNAKPSISSYCSSESYLSINQDNQNRINLLFGIHRYLHRVYQNNPELAYSWLMADNEDFDDNSPYQHIINNGYTGLNDICDYLASRSMI